MISTYAWLMIGSLVAPLLLSFDKKVAFYKQWPALFTGIILNGLLFITWDGWFVREGIWSFNPDHVWSLRINDLPIEEWSFFVVVPYASVFIYACVKAWIKPVISNRGSVRITLFFALLSLGLSLFFSDRTYTLVNAGICSLVLFATLLSGYAARMGAFWLAYLIHLIPFGIVNGVLTALPVVLYNDAENMGIRVGSIPAEDFLYALTCLLIPVLVMEKLQDRKTQISSTLRMSGGK